MSKKQILMWFSRKRGIFCAIVLSLTFTFLQPTLAQQFDATSCLSINREAGLNELDLPDNARLILHDRSEQSLRLVNLLDGTVTPIPQTSGIVDAYLFDNNQRLLVKRELDELDNGWVWQTINLSNFATRLIWIENWTDVSYFEFQPSNQILFFNLSSDADYVIDLLTRTIRDLPEPEWINPILPRPVTEGIDPLPIFAYSPNSDRVAYAADDTAILQDVILATTIIRIQTLSTNEVVDIPWLDFFDWSPNGELISGEAVSTANTDQFVHIYDSNIGNLRYEISPPLEDYSIHASGIWSPNSEIIPLRYENAFNSVESLYFYDLVNNVWMDNCFFIENDIYYDDRGGQFYWTADNRFIWWREESTTEPNIFNIVVADIETGAYGVVATDVGVLSKFSIPIDLD